MQLSLRKNAAALGWTFPKADPDKGIHEQMIYERSTPRRMRVERRDVGEPGTASDGSCSLTPQESSGCN